MFTFKRILFCVSVMIGVAATAATWQMADDGSIVLSGDKLADYSDHVEMSGMVQALGVTTPAVSRTPSAAQAEPAGRERLSPSAALTR